jgi:hypothetical protein
MSWFGLVVEPINLTSVLRDGGKGENIVEIKTHNTVDVVDERFHVLL